MVDMPALKGLAVFLRCRKSQAAIRSWESVRLKLRRSLAQSQVSAQLMDGIPVSQGLVVCVCDTGCVKP